MERVRADLPDDAGARVLAALARLRESARRDPDWELRPEGSDEVVVLRPPGRHGRCWCVLSRDAAAEALVCHALLPARCPPERRAAVAELCMRVNRRLAFGRLGLDPDLGDVSFMMAWPECMVGETLVPFVQVFVTLLERHLPAAMMVLEGAATPSAALAAIEASASRLAW